MKGWERTQELFWGTLCLRLWHFALLELLISLTRSGREGLLLFLSSKQDKSHRGHKFTIDLLMKLSCLSSPFVSGFVNFQVWQKNAIAVSALFVLSLSLSLSLSLFMPVVKLGNRKVWIPEILFQSQTQMNEFQEMVHIFYKKQMS